MGVKRRCPNTSGATQNECAGECASLSSSEEQKDGVYEKNCPGVGGGLGVWDGHMPTEVYGVIGQGSPPGERRKLCQTFCGG